MRKLRTDSNWRRLDTAQREMVEKWLFDDHLGYEEIVARAKTEFGLETSISSVARYFRHRSQERQATGLAEAKAMSNFITGSELGTDAMRAAALKLIAKTALKIAWERPDRLRDLEALAKILLFSEDNDIRRRHLKLKQQQFHYNAARAAGEEIPRLAGLLLQIEDDDSLDPEAKLEKVRELLFPDSTGSPKSSPAATNENA
jgi:hypothetical protein